MMAGSTNHPITSQCTQKKRSHHSSTQVRGLVRIRSKVDKDTKKDTKNKSIVLSIFDNLFTSKSSKNEAKGRKMSILKENDKVKVEGSATNGSTNAEASEAPKFTEGSITTFTAIEDVALKALKADGMSWKEIGKLFSGKKLGDIKARYKELKAAAKTSDAADANEEEGEEDDTEGAKIGNVEKLASSKGKGKSKVNNEGEGAELVTAKAETSTKTSSTKGSSSHEVPIMRVQMETGEKIILGDIVDTRNGEVLTAREVAHLLSYVPRYEKQMWKAIASRCQEKTSKRIDYLELMKVVKNAYVERCQRSCCPPDKA